MTTRVNTIEAAISTARLRRFIDLAGSQSAALRLYRWNAQVAAAYWTPLHTYVTTYAHAKALDFTPYADELPRYFLAKWK